LKGRHQTSLYIIYFENKYRAREQSSRHQKESKEIKLYFISSYFYYFLKLF